MLQSLDGMDHIQLYILRHRGGEALDIHFLGIQTHGFNKQLMSGFIGKPHHLVLDGWTIPGANAFHLAGIQGRTIQIFPDDMMGVSIGIRQMTYRTVFRYLFGLKREGDAIGFPLLHLQIGKINAPAVDAGRGTGLKAHELQSHGTEGIGQADGGKHAIRAAVIKGVTNNDSAL